MKLGKALVFALTLSLGVGTASAQSIDIFSDLAGTSCQTTVTGAPFTIYIQARLGGLAAGGLTGCEFWVSGMPAGWFVIPTPGPNSNISLGNPFATAEPFRTNIAFPTCQTDALVLLYTVNVIPTSAIGPTRLRVQVSNPPTNVLYLTPIFTLCDAPEYTAIPVAGGEFFMNETVECTVGVQETTWSQVKGLYTN